MSETTPLSDDELLHLWTDADGDSIRHWIKGSQRFLTILRSFADRIEAQRCATLAARDSPESRGCS
jgi:hypothetical protein